jgi:peptide/nickel transport system permease protein
MGVRRLLFYVILRVLFSIVTVLFLLTLVFVIIRVVPGDPATALLPPDTPAEILAQYRRELGLDKPLYVQYADYLANIARGRWGRSLALNAPVLSTILTNLPTTVELTVLAMAIGVIVGVVGGLVSSMKRDTAVDHSIRLLTVAGYALPSFWLGLMLQLLFGVYLGILPTDGRIDITLSPARITGFLTLDSLISLDMTTLSSALKHLVLPSITLAIHSTSLLTRVTRGEIIEQIGRDYILVLHAKGLSRPVVFGKHALRNALLPVITLIALQTGVLLGGAIVTETVFNLPGTGRLLIRSFLARDYPMIQGLLAVNTFMITLVMLVMDLAYFLIDPRIRRSK